ncbi:MAG TPA: HYR domain-containing protein [Candidatus Thermoplasmatota archaeon]|nr:HYR domain-containing protein [Candidatus Thermoplasmatota archaeon]
MTISALAPLAGAAISTVTASAPSSATAGASFTVSGSVTATSTGTGAGGQTVTLSIASGPAGGALIGTTTGTTSGSQTSATYSISGVKLDKAGAYVLRATVGSVSGNTGTITINPAASTKLEWHTIDLTPPEAPSPVTIKVSVHDVYGNLVTSDSTTKVKLESQSVISGGNLQLTQGQQNGVTAVNGIVTFEGKYVNKDCWYSVFANATGRTSPTPARVRVGDCSDDATPPVITLASRLPAANAAGWNNGDVVVTWECRDAESDVIFATVTNTVSTEGAGQSTTGTCTNYASLTASHTVTGINIDRTAPVLSGTRSPAPNAAGWNNADVTVSFACTDALSGVASVTGPQVVSTEGTAQSRSGSCVDLAGNSASATVSGINLDKTAPSVVASRSPAANAAGWNNDDVTVSFACTDARSGVASTSPAAVVSTEGSGQSRTGSCTDVAGNSASATMSNINIDRTPPVLTGAKSPASEWSNGDVTVTFSCVDALSNVASVTGPQVVTTSGAGQSRSGSCVDHAGNSVSGSVSNINIDRESPTLTLTPACSAPGTDGFCLGETTVSVSLQDSLSGPQGTSCTLNGVSTSCASLSASEDGSYTFFAEGFDVANNRAESTYTIVIDSTKPSVSVQDTCATAGDNGWCRSSVSLAFSASDENGLAAGYPQCTDNGAPIACGGSVTSEGLHTVSILAQDVPGNENSASTTFKIDTIAPTLTSIESFSVEATGASGAVATFALPLASDGGSGPGAVSCAPASGSLFALGTTQVTCSVSDLAGNTASTTFDVTVVDSSAPVIDAMADDTFEAESGLGAVYVYTAPAVRDAVDGVSAATCSPASGTLFPLGTTTVTCTATDAAGNIAESVSFDVTIVDSTGPSVVASEVQDLSAEATGPTGAIVSFAAPATYDAVDGAGVATCSPASGSLFPLGETTVTCTATDAAGNEATAVTFVVTVVDTTGPSIDAMADDVVEATSALGATYVYAAPATFDIVDGAGVASCLPASGSVFALGETTVTCSATDAAGNAADAVTFTVTVQDTTPPTIAAMVDLVLEAASDAGAEATFDAPATSDAVDGAGVATCDAESGAIFPLGVTIVTCTAIDAAGNAADAVTFKVTVRDTSAPIIDGIVEDAELEAVDANGARFTYDAPSTSDLVDGAGIATCTPPSGSVFPLGETTVTCTATDENGNEASPVSFIVKVVDTSKPLIAAVEDVTAEATGPTGAVVTYTAPSWSDAVDGVGIASCSPASGGLFALGETTVTCTATDAAGNEADAVSFTVTVLDRIAPVTTLGTSGFLTSSMWYTSQPSVSLTCVDAVGCTATYYTLNGGSPIAYTGVFTLPDGVHTVAYWSEDAANTESASSRTFRVDTTPPTLVLPSSITSATQVVTYTVTATDNVDLAPSWTCTPASGSTFAVGTTMVECTATDEAGHQTSGVFSVTVQRSCSSSTWTGLLQPVNADGTSVFKLGSTIPLKFRCGDQGTATVKVSMQKLSNGIYGAEVEATSTSGADSGNTFRWSSTDGQYIYNLATKPLSEGTWFVKVDFGNGDVRETKISLRK